MPSEKTPMDLIFHKSGTQIKEACQGRIDQLQQRLDRRMESLEAFADDRPRLLGFLVRSSYRNWGHGEGPSRLVGEGEISSEEIEEMDQLCRRISELQAEIQKLNVIVHHLASDAEVELSYRELVEFGFA